MDVIARFISDAAGNFWNVIWWAGPVPVPGPIAVLLGTGVILTAATRGIQFTRVFLGFKMMLKGAFHADESEKDAGEIPPYQALMTALASTVGNGNIAGVATAIVSGGPGALFWMWVTAIVGMATKFAESVLAVHFRTTLEDGSVAGGPMYYIRVGFEGIPFLRRFGAPLAGAFAFFGAWSSLFGTGNMMQTNSMALAFNQQMGVPFWLTGIVVTTLVSLVIIGGIKRIGRIAEFLVPGMIFLYVFGGLYIILTHITGAALAFKFIVASAFTPQAAFGGFAGHTVKQALQYGVRRGLLSNESGLGSAPIAHGASRARNPVRQGLIAMVGTFIDTLVVCTMTGLVILLTGAYMVSDPHVAGNTLTSTALTAYAFASSIPFVGGYIVAFSSALFGYSTVLGWYYYGERCFDYLFGLKAIKAYKIIFVIMTFTGALLQGERLQIVWNIGDLTNGFMAFPNLVGLIFLSRLVYTITREYVGENKI